MAHIHNINHQVDLVQGNRTSLEVDLEAHAQPEHEKILTKLVATEADLVVHPHEEAQAHAKDRHNSRLVVSVILSISQGRDQRMLPQQ